MAHKQIEITPENIVETLKTLRDEKGLTQSQLSEQTGLAQNAICRMEKGQTPNFETLCKIIGALGRKLVIK